MAWVDPLSKYPNMQSQNAQSRLPVTLQTLFRGAADNFPERLKEMMRDAEKL
jgi:hypothetical protein